MVNSSSAKRGEIKAKIKTKVDKIFFLSIVTSLGLRLNYKQKGQACQGKSLHFFTLLCIKNNSHAKGYKDMQKLLIITYLIIRGYLAVGLKEGGYLSPLIFL
jgi:hypothetical protein